jgi:hypothetical protein
LSYLVLSCLCLFRFCYDLHLHGPTVFICPYVSARGIIFEFENNSSLMLSIVLDPVPHYRSTIERGFHPTLVKINFTPDELPGFLLLEFPPAAFPKVIIELGKIVQVFNQMYIHSAPSLSCEMFMSKMGYELHIRDMSSDFLSEVMESPRMRTLFIITSYGENKKPRLL